MENNNIDNNQVTILGDIASGFTFSHEIFGEGFYSMDVTIPRLSGVCDIIPVTVSERLINVKEDLLGRKVLIKGQFRSYNKHEESKNRLKLSVFAREIMLDFTDEETGGNDDINEVYISGHICKEPVCRTTPLGRKIADLLLAVNRPYGKSDYIPCVCWSRNAKYVGSLPVGTKCDIKGRIQSRQYVKYGENEEPEYRTAYEISVQTVGVEENDKS